MSIIINFPMDSKLSPRKYLILAINFENLPYTFSILPREHAGLKHNRKFSGLSHGLGNLPSWRRKGPRLQICLKHSVIPISLVISCKRSDAVVWQIRLSDKQWIVKVTHKDATKTFHYTTITDRLTTVSFSDNSHPSNGFAFKRTH